MARLFTGFLIVFFLLGVALIAIGAQLPGRFGATLLVGTGLAMGPGALVALLFRTFLVDDVQRQFIEPLTTQVRASLREIVPDELDGVLRDYRQEISNIKEIRQGGLVRCYRNREEALDDFIERYRTLAEPRVTTVVGSSLMGLLPTADCPFAALVKDDPAAFTFVLTHPVVADLRAHQENRPRQDIGVEIVARLRLLHELGVRGDQVFLYRGAPTLFGIMTNELMLLNPYPYEQVAMDSPCLLATMEVGADSYFFEAFRGPHFQRMRSVMSEPAIDLLRCAEELERRLPRYSEVADLVETLTRTPPLSSDLAA